MSDREERVKEIIKEQLDVEASDVVGSANFIRDLGGDSLDRVELIMALEDEFDIQIDDEQAEKVETVQDAINLVLDRIGR